MPLVKPATLKQMLPAFQNIYDRQVNTNTLGPLGRAGLPLEETDGWLRATVPAGFRQKYADGGAVAKGLDTPSKNPVGQYIPLYDMRAQRLVDDIKERRDQAEGLQNLKSIRETAGNVGLAAASAYPMARGALAAAPWVGKALTMMRTGVRTPGALGLGAAANVGLGALLDEEGRTPLGAATNAAKGAGYTAFPLGGMTADALVGSDKAEGSPLLDTIKLMRPVAARWVSSNPELQKILHGYGYAKAPSNFNYTNMIGALRQASKEMQMPNALNWQGVRDVGPMTNGAGD